MKLRIELTDGSDEDEVVIRCGRVNDTIQKLQEYILTLTAPKLTFYKDAQEYYLSLDDILFFETDGEQVFAHTKSDAFKVKHRLYELEDMLPKNFVRAAKGTIVNTLRIYTINRNLTASSLISFSGTHKQIYVSRHYYSALKAKMKERSV
ncbi:MAG: LytTR family transcriptional regulator [Oscillospiraceae bacterium]|nr:LytTR family transcriptional regulator [Oscillospiraceae bacterium]